MNTRTMLSAFAFALSALAVSACNGGSPSYNPPPPGPTCQPNSGNVNEPAVQLIYPAPNATGVPDATGQVVFAVSSALPNSWDAYVQTSSSYNPYAGLSGGGLTTITAAQVPTPAATPSFPNPVYQSSSLGNAVFGSGVNVYVWLNNTGTNCTPQGPLGSFTTK